jgi:FAD/FMN-containing dehydrogenase/Fe-S oxidoreductase
MSADLVVALRAAGVDDVDDSALTRSLYSSDASVYRVPPRVVARPRHPDEIAAVLAVARESRTPVTMRGAGTSIAGNAIGPGIVVDTRRHLDQVLSIDPDTATAVVQPGTVHATVQRAAAPYGLRFGPDPSTHTRCTIGGMIGNNACGSRALGYGRTVDNVVAMRALTADGADAHVLGDRMAGLVDSELALVRTEFGRFSRQGSGYSLEHLLPERGRSLDRFLVGTEGTLAVVTEATLRLVREPGHRVLVVLGYRGMAEAADAVPSVLEHDPVACEGMDERLARLVPAMPSMPAGGGWLLVEVAGDDRSEVLARCDLVVRAAGAGDHRVVEDVGEQAAIWRVREDGAGLAARATDPPGQAGWEDAAVPPERLGAYLRDFDALLASHGLDGAPYGHLGDGCLHIRIGFDLASDDGRRRYRVFVQEAADLAAGHGGSLSGEHGDGRARSELLGRMYSAEALALMGRVKALADPEDLLNPGVLVRPAPLDADVRLAAPMNAGPVRLRLRDDLGLVEAVHRCTGVGKCVADSTGSGGVMCPSYLATGEEKDSTRGRARVLQDAVSGRLPGLEADEVDEALDLCLACKGCLRDCPTGVDMATYKVEALHRRYAGKRRPRTHVTLGRLPQLLARTPARVVRAALRTAPGALARAAGVDPRRTLPLPAPRPVSSRRDAAASDPAGADVVLWLDTFTDRFAPQVADAARRVLQAAGATVHLVADGRSCCGLTLYSTGQLDAAARSLTQMLAALDRVGADGLPVVVLEPSCLSLLRHDAVQLIDDPSFDPSRFRSLAEHLEATGWEPPDLEGVEVVAQPHCHQVAVVGWDRDAALLQRAGATLMRVGGCCGLAGDFGMTPDHYDVSVRVFEHDLGPAVRAAPDAVVLADGFSCRTQLADLGAARGVHLAELLSGRLLDPPADAGTPRGTRHSRDSGPF